MQRPLRNVQLASWRTRETDAGPRVDEAYVEESRMGGYEDGFRDGMLTLALMVAMLVLFGLVGGIERGTIPLPWEI